MKVVRQYGRKCPNCLEEIYSNYQHDFKYCWCGAIMIDGGFDYMRYGWDGVYATRKTTKRVSRIVCVLPENSATSKNSLDWYEILMNNKFKYNINDHVSFYVGKNIIFGTVIDRHFSSWSNTNEYRVEEDAPATDRYWLKESDVIARTGKIKKYKDT